MGGAKTIKIHHISLKLFIECSVQIQPPHRPPVWRHKIKKNNICIRNLNVSDATLYSIPIRIFGVPFSSVCVEFRERRYNCVVCTLHNNKPHGFTVPKQPQALLLPILFFSVYLCTRAHCICSEKRNKRNNFWGDFIKIWKTKVNRREGERAARGACCTNRCVPFLYSLMQLFYYMLRFSRNVDF